MITRREQGRMMSLADPKQRALEISHEACGLFHGMYGWCIDAANVRTDNRRRTICDQFGRKCCRRGVRSSPTGLRRSLSAAKLSLGRAIAADDVRAEAGTSVVRWPVFACAHVSNFSSFFLPIDH